MHTYEQTIPQNLPSSPGRYVMLPRPHGASSCSMGTQEDLSLRYKSGTRHVADLENDHSRQWRTDPKDSPWMGTNGKEDRKPGVLGPVHTVNNQTAGSMQQMTSHGG